MTNIIEPKYTPKQQQTNWINLIHGTHDQFCGCDDVILHTLQAFSTNNTKKVSSKQLQEIKWLLTGEQDGDAAKDGDAVDALNIGDLDALFAGEDVTEDSPSG